jgi:LCP family protein required for cell wall assembly
VFAVQPALPPRRRQRSLVPAALMLVAVVGASSAAGVIRAANDRTDAIERLPELDAVLSGEDDGPSENYLLVGSDTRENSDPDSPDFGGIGDANEVSGRRSDTIMILRLDRETGVAALLSLPRDLWIEIPGHGHERINSAYSKGADVLARTVSETLGIPVHHYVEIDFVGFKSLVDQIGGVEVCVDAATKDDNTGLRLNPGCSVLDGVAALAYVRSRHYEQFIDGVWQEDPTADLGRIERQQDFIRLAADKALQRIKSDPFATGALIGAVTSSVRLDPDIEPVKAANVLTRAVDAGLMTYTLPVQGDSIDGKSVLVLDVGADVVINYFAGTGPPPPAS